LLGDLPRYVGHIRGTPCKDIGVCAEKVDEHDFLFGVKIGVDCRCLAVRVVGVEWDLLGAFCCLEAACMALWLRCLSNKCLKFQG
jgi:hypothetical protein